MAPSTRLGRPKEFPQVGFSATPAEDSQDPITDFTQNQETELLDQELHFFDAEQNPFLEHSLSASTDYNSQVSVLPGYDEIIAKYSKKDIKHHKDYFNELIDYIKQVNTDYGYQQADMRQERYNDTSDLAEKETLLAEKEAQLAQKISLLNQKDATIAEKDSVFAQKDATITEKDSLLATNDSLLREKEAQIVELNSLLTQKDATIAEKDSLLSEKDAEIAALKQHNVSSSPKQDLLPPMTPRTRISSESPFPNHHPLPDSPSYAALIRQTTNIPADAPVSEPNPAPVQHILLIRRKKEYHKFIPVNTYYKPTIRDNIKNTFSSSNPVFVTDIFVHPSKDIRITATTFASKKALLENQKWIPKEYYLVKPSFRMIAFGIPTPENNPKDEDLKDELAPFNSNIQNGKVSIQILKKEIARCERPVILQTDSPEIANKLIDKGLMISEERVIQVYKSKQKLTQCTKCASFQHPSHQCKQQIDICFNCSKDSKSHVSNPCTHEPKCKNCDGNHTSDDKRCPTRREQITKLNTEHYNSTPFFHVPPPFTDDTDNYPNIINNTTR